MSKKPILAVIPDGYHSEAYVLSFASKIIPVVDVMSIIATLRKECFSQRMTLIKGKRPEENMYVYTDCFAEKAEERFLEKKAQIINSVAAENFSAISNVAKQLGTTPKEVKMAVEKTFGTLPNFLVRAKGNTYLLHDHVVVCIKPFFKKEKSVPLLYVANLDERVKSKGRVETPQLYDEAVYDERALSRMFA